MRTRSNLVVNVIRLFMISIGLMFCSVAESDLSTSHAGRVSPGSGTELAIPSMPTVGETSTSVSQPTAFIGTATLLAPTVTATKSHTPTGNRSPGDTLTYTVVISASGMDATGVNFTDTIDPNTTLVANSLVVSPIAVNDTYNTIGNVNISVPVAQGVVANDLNPGGMGTLTVTQVNGTAVPGTVATTHGSVTMAADGSFTYNPTAGFGGPSDSFTYTLGNGTGKTDTATVTINISGRIWFVNSAAGSNGDGRLSSPFNILTGAGSADSVDAANDVIFLYSSATSYTGGMTLNSGEIIIGQGASQSILSITGFTAPSGTNLLPATGGSNPTIMAASANEITLNSNNQIWGTTFGTTTGTSITGSAYGTLKVRDTTITNGSGQALNLNTGTMDVILQSLTSTNSSSTGMTLNAGAGSFSVTGTTSVTNSGGAAVNLTSNTGTITFAALNIANTTSNQTGLNATENTNTITTTSGTINTGSGGAVNVTRSSSTTPLAISLTSVSSSGGSANGIILSNTSGSFTVNGDGSNTTLGGNSSGGTIASKSGSDGSTTQGSGIFLNNAQNVTLRRMTINGTLQNFGIKGASVTTFTLEFSTVSGTIGTTEAGGSEEGPIRFDGLTGSAAINSCVLGGAFSVNLRVTNAGGTLNRLVVDTCTFNDVNSSSTNGGSSIIYDVGAAGSGGTLNYTITNSIFNGSRSTMLHTTAHGGSHMDAVVTQNKFINADTHILSGTGGIILDGGDNGAADVTFNISCNKVSTTAAGGAKGAGLNIFKATNSTSGSFVGTVSGNAIGVTGQSFSGAPNSAPAIWIQAHGAGTYTTLIQNNTILEYGEEAIDIQGTQGSTTLNCSIFGNTVTPHCPDGFAGLNIEQGALAADSGTMNIVVGNSNSGSGQQNDFSAGDCANSTDIQVLRAATSSTVLNLSKNGSSSSTVTNVLKDDNANSANTNVGDFSPGNRNLVTTLPSTPPAVSGCTLPASIRPTPAERRAQSPDAQTAGQADTPTVDDLVVAKGRNPEEENVPRLSQVELDAMVQAAIERWRQAGISDEDLARLRAATFEVDSLPGGEIATAVDSRVKIDETAAGYAWFYDQTPADDNEFAVPVFGREIQTTELSPAHGRMDLLTVVMRELGLVYLQGKKDGIPDGIRPLMESTLSPGVRRLPDYSLVQISTPASDSASGTSEQGSSTLGSGSSRATRAVTARSQLMPQSGETINQGLGTIPQGKSVTLMFQVTVNNPFPAGVCTVTNQAQITGSNFPAVMSNSDVATVFKPVTIGACPTNITKNADSGKCTAVTTFTPPTADGCPVPTVTCVPASGFAFPKGTTTVTCTASNATPPDATCSFTVTVNDNQAPTLTCPANITKSTDPNVCTAAVNFTTTISDNCPGATFTCTPASGATFPKGTTTVNCTGMDTSGNPATPCSFTVTVNDTQAPTLTACPANITKSNDTGLCSAVATYTAPTATDNCPGVSAVSCSPPSGGAFPKGTTTVTCSAMDTSANTASCMFTVTVNDTEAPVVTCPASGGVFAPSTDCLPPANGAYTDASAVTYSGGTITLSNKILFNLSGCDTPPTAPPGTSTTHSYNAQFRGTLTINPNPAAPFQAPATAQIKVTFNNTAGSTRTFDTEMLQLDISGGNLSANVRLRESPTLQSTGQTKITSLGGGGFRIDSFFDVFTEISTDGGATWSPSSGSSHLAAVQTTDANVCTAVVSYPPATATDNCPGVNTPTCSPASGTTFNKGVTTVTCSTTDATGNPGNCTFTITVIDAQLPAITCPANITTNESSPGSGSATVTYTTPTPTDNCTPAPTASCAPASGSSFAVGTTTVTCTATDSSANINTCSFTVTVNPLCSLTCNPNITTNTAPNVCAAVVTYSQPTVSGSCGTVTCSPASGSTFAKGVTTVTCTSTVGPSCSFTVTVNDNQPPVLSNCPSNITKSTDPNLCTAVVTYTNPTATDNCPGVGTPNCSPASGSAFAKGVTTVTCNVSDATGNPASCSFTVTVNDTQAPTLTNCPTNMTKTTDPNLCSAVVTYTNPTASDNCPGLGTPACNPPSGTAFPKGVTTVTCTVSDSATPPNTASCSFTVTVNDTQAPTITCPANIIKSTDPNLCSAVTTFTVTATDNCPGVTVVSSPPSGSVFPKGTTTVTSTATDTSGSTATCTFTVTVNDTQPPSIMCPANITAPTDPGVCTARVSYMTPAVDNCPGVVVVCVPASGSTFAKGTTTVMCTATDASSNTATCAFTVTVVDQQAPNIVCPSNFTATGVPTGSCVTATFPAPTVTDNCPGVGAPVCTPPSGSCFPIGITTVTCTVTDSSGNTASCQFSVATFDICLENDGGGATLLINSLSGDYVACFNGSVFVGKATVTQKGCYIFVTQSGPDRRLNASVDKCQMKGSASFQFPPGTTLFTIVDRNIADNACACSLPQANFPIH